MKHIKKSGRVEWVIGWIEVREDAPGVITSDGISLWVSPGRENARHPGRSGGGHSSLYPNGSHTGSRFRVFPRRMERIES